MAEIASAFVSIAPSAKGFGSKLSSQVGSETRSAGSSLGKTFGKLFVLGASVIAAAGIGSFLKGSVDEAREAQKVGAQTNAVLKSTGQVANVSSTQIGKLATSLSNKIGVDDEAIQAGENMLLTFTNVRNEVGEGNNIFAQATATVQDMAAAFGGDAVSNSKILGKALNDPVKGVSALTRVGVSFTQGQKDQIAALVKSGDVLGAQKIILGELTKETQGSAEAQATAGDKAKVAFGNIKEAVGTALLPVLDKLEVFFVAKIVPALYSTVAAAKRLGPLFRQVGGFIGKAFAGVLPAVVAFASAIRDQVVAALPKIGAAARAALPVAKTFLGQLQTAVSNLAPILSSLVSEFLSFLPTVVSLASTIASALGPALVAVTGFMSKHATTVKAVAVAIIAMVAAYKVAKLATAAFAVIQGVLNAVLDANPIGIIILALVGLAAGLIYAYKHSETFRAVVDTTFKAIKKIISAVISYVVPFVKQHWQLLVAIIGGPMGIIVGLVIKHFGTIKSFISSAIQFVIQRGKDTAKFAQAVGDAVGKVVKFFRELPGKIKGFLTGLPGELKKIGADIINGLVNGIKGAAHYVTDAVQSIIDKIPKKIRDLMHINSPAKTMIPLGSAVPEGLAVGMERGSKHAEDAAGNVADKIGKKLKEKISKLRDQLSSARSDFASLVEPISSNFTQGLFDFDTASAFTTNLATVKGTLTTLIGNFKTLVGEGLSPGFLYRLFQEGGPALINSLAGLSKADALGAASLFGDVQSLSDQLGTQVAGATDKGAALEKQTARLEHKIDQLIHHVDESADRTGRVINGAASNGRRRAA